MGNGSSCCGYSDDNRAQPRADDKGRGALSADGQRAAAVAAGGGGGGGGGGASWPWSRPDLQHISERGAEDGEPDPSQDPTASTMFMERSKARPSQGENGLARKRSQHQIAGAGAGTGAECKLKKSSSCSTIYLDDSTVSQPNLKNTVKCASLAIYYHIKSHPRGEGDEDAPSGDGDRRLDVFDERLHPLPRSGSGAEEPPEPEHRHIYKFVRTLFNAAQLTAECAIITLVYLERLLVCAELEIRPSNWKRIVLGAILLASKVWDDQAVWNVDYCQILKDITVEDMNELERKFLELLQFNINVSSSVYVKYYFDLRTLAEAHDLAFPAEPLSKDRAQKLEAMSRAMEDRIAAEMIGNGIKKWSSVDDVGRSGGPRRSVAILS